MFEQMDMARNDKEYVTFLVNPLLLLNVFLMHVASMRVLKVYNVCNYIAKKSLVYCVSIGIIFLAYKAFSR